MEPNMFCYQCQETAKGTGCILKGVCGKESHTAQAMDLLLFVVRGVSVVADVLRKADCPVSEEVNIFVTDALFCTITNANFDDESILKRVDKGITMRNGLIQEAKHNKVLLPKVDELTWQGTRDDYAGKAKTVGVLREQNEDLRSLKELLVYGLKGMAAYLEHVMRLGFNDDTVHVFMQRALATIAFESLSAEEWVKLVLEAGEFGVKTMALLDAANTGTYGNPEITKVNIGVKNRPGILISGHDLKDMEELLKQTEGTGIDVYTHGEMLPAHYYPAFKKYSHFVGNYGNAWWKQREEFTSFNGPILFTTNCIVPPLANAVYKERMFTTNSTGYPGCKYIDKDAEGRKDFSEIIEIAKQCQPPVEIEHGEIIGGFAHNQVLQLADKVVNAVSSVGVVDAVGRVWEWLDELITRAEHATNADYHASVAWGWDKKSPLNTGEKSYDVGNIYQYYAYSLAALGAGGSWDDGANCGARAVKCHNSPWRVYASVGARGACDSL